jgi:hypothetical protein
MDEEFLILVFDFASTHAHDDGVLLFFRSDAPKVKATLKSYMEAYNFSIFKEWMEVH